MRKVIGTRVAVKAIFRGLTGRADTAAALSPISASDTRRRLELLEDFEAAGIGWLWASDPQGRLIYLSQSAAESLGIQTENLIGKSLSDLFEADPDNPNDKPDRPLKFQLNTAKRINELVVRLAPLEERGTARRAWWSITALPKHTAEGQFLGYRGSAKDVSVEYQRKLEESRLAEYDSLTGLANRHRITRRLEATLAAYKAARRSCGLMMLDLDRFKQVNDTMGHPAGDELLRQVARRLEKVIGHRGEIGRLGGDEFQIILPDLDDRARLGELAQTIIQVVSQPYPIEGKRAVVGTSVGIGIAPYDGVTREELVRSTDLALYAAKHGGRGQFRFFSAELKDEAEERRQLLEDLKGALTSDQLEMHYQPVVRVADSRVISLEALMRWDHPERGAVPPTLFIAVAEEANLINEVGEWALRRAVRDACGWPETVGVAVNVSAVQFANPGFITVVTDVLAESGLRPDRLELELTESVFMGDSETTAESFRALKALGVRLALDDFGTGYSSLAYLRSAPFDRLKVDRTFVDSCTVKEDNSVKIIAAIISLSDALGMETTVEGVEAFDQLEVVCAHGARFIQGYLFARPMKLADVAARFQSGEFRITPDGPDRHRPERRSVFRRIGIIHEDHRYEAVMRDLSRTGARVDGLLGVPEGTDLVLDLGGGQLVVCAVTRTEDATIAVEFETPLVSDGAGGLCTRHRVSPYTLAAAGMPLEALPPGQYPLSPGRGPQGGAPRFMEVTTTPQRSPAPAPAPVQLARRAG